MTFGASPSAGGGRAAVSRPSVDQCRGRHRGPVEHAQCRRIGAGILSNSEQPLGWRAPVIVSPRSDRGTAMKRIFLLSAALSACITSAEAASLPPPAKLCAMIAATADEGNQTPAVWQKATGGYFCRADGMSAPSGGVVFMNT